LRNGNRLLHVHGDLPAAHVVAHTEEELNIEHSTSNPEVIGKHRTEPVGSTLDGSSSLIGAGRRMRRLPERPSVLYGAALWRLGVSLARVAPERALKNLAAALGTSYARCAPRRREAVIDNLRPALNGDADEAERVAAKLFQQFVGKLVDLWRFEAGIPVAEMFRELAGWENFLKAQQTGRGVLVVTPHLGNWEFGAPLLTKHGFKLHVITLVEPGHGLTELRQAARARWGIETLVIGRDPFAFVEIIRRLEAGATVALLIDRPPKTSAIEVELFGRPFSASIAAAELARATNCEILPVYLPRVKDGYAAHILPRIEYERTALRDRNARQQLTQQIISALEPAIRQHLEQWYHFVPVWR
jgi:KDO2-lipid IV(A) lauroyltransferase